MAAQTTPATTRRMRFEEYNTLRHEARKVFTQAVTQGLIARQPCQVCGKQNSEGHHSDYREPLIVEWLCRTHHLNIHKGYSHLWQFLGADSGFATDAIERDLPTLYAIREAFRKSGGQPVNGYTNWLEYVHHNSRLSTRTIQRWLSKRYGKDERKINLRFVGGVQ